MENVARTIKDDVLGPVFAFITPKLESANWGDRYIGMIAFAAVIEGPSQESIISIIGSAFESIVNMLNDPAAKVR